MNANKGTLFFFTGLAGAGKTTIGGLFYERLKQRKPNAVLIDGHVAREQAVASGAPRDYSIAARLAGAKNTFRNCKDMTDRGIDIVCCSMSLFDEVRKWNRENIENYKEIYIRTDMEVLRQRRVELYSGREQQVVGMDLPWDEPTTPDIIIDNNGSQSSKEIVDRLEGLFL